MEEKGVEALVCNVETLEGSEEKELDEDEDINLEETARGIEEGDVGRGIIEGEAGRGREMGGATITGKEMEGGGKGLRSSIRG